ncbi:hypothetical protein FACS189459_3270 [Bacilli bacterium]|nr:hypothetical protein FACS189459_3270 [Bacilli bacterium]
MADNSKTIKYEQLDNDDLERIKVSPTVRINPNAVDDSDDDLESMSRAELEYMLKFNDLDQQTIEKIKGILLTK